MEKHKEPYYPATRPGSTSYRAGSQGQNNPSGTRSAHAHSEAQPKPHTDPVLSLARYSALFYSNFRFEMEICVSGCYYPSQPATARLPSGMA